MGLKNFIRKALIFLHLDITQNLKYDRLTNLIIRRVVGPTTNCIDVGCHKGEILDLILHQAPTAKHFAFEPIPYLFASLQKKYTNQASLYPYALSNQNGQTTFNVVKNAPAYSGLNKRQYAVANPDIEEITVEVRTLDSLIPQDITIHFIKIDVEGGEFGVLKGAEQLLKRCKPTILFECGLGASNFYGTNPTELYQYLTQTIGLQVYTLQAFTNQAQALTQQAFTAHYNNNTEYYFVAAK